MNDIRANFHTHSTFCDGKNTLSEMVLEAIRKNFSALGFSGHGYTPFDLSYCMQDMDAYAAEVRRLQEAYRDRLEIYLGVEEDAFAPVDRSRFDYVLGSAHYIFVQGQYVPVDSSRDRLLQCMEAFNNDPVALAEAYYSAFCDYIQSRRPDIIGHFDLITKFDEKDAPLFLQEPAYHRLAQAYIKEAAKANCLFEVNTGAIARGYRVTPYPHEQLLTVLKKEDAKLILNSDCHKAEALDCAFDETLRYLYDLGFRTLYTMRGGRFVPYSIR